MMFYLIQFIMQVPGLMLAALGWLNRPLAGCLSLSYFVCGLEAQFD
jgi:hypothetical protein